MLASLNECVANCSEGSNVKTIQAFAHSISTVKDVILFDRHEDVDHHRCVLTFAGPTEAVTQAAFELVNVSKQLIDLRQHIGQHPRIGATDVLPFIPLKGSTMDQCVNIAKIVGERVGAELGIPVFLYEEASEQPYRKSLEAIRRGGLFNLSQRMKSDPFWVPDFGPSNLHPTAGAIAIGARYPLIAFNIMLQTKNVAVAQEIAKIIRASNGGLPGVKALGMELKSKGLVQVSMNLTNFHKTPLHVACEMVENEARQRGISIAGSELVGLIPQEAVMQSASYFSKCDWWEDDKILETHIRHCQIG